MSRHEEIGTEAAVNGAKAVASSSEHRDYVTMSIGGQLFGIPVLKVQDVLGSQTITRVPLAPVEVAGSLNLRGRIVTAVDVRLRRGRPGRGGGGAAGAGGGGRGDERY